MKPWLLIAPDWAHLDEIWRSNDPFLLWPVCEKTLLAYWLDEAVRLGVPAVIVEAMDRPHLIRQWLNKRDLWSRAIDVLSTSPDRANFECFFLDGLPGQAGLPAVTSAKELMQRWYDLQVEALNRRSSGMVHLDHEYRPGVWFGPGAKAHPDVVFMPPCWVGSHARIERGGIIGPEAFIGPSVLLDEDVEVKESIVCKDTYVGPHTSLNRVAVQGGLLMDFQMGLSIEVIDDFVLTSMTPMVSRPNWIERIVAVLIAPVLEGCARLFNRGVPSEETIVHLTRSLSVTLRSYPKGPLILRRAPWFRLVASGRMKILGVLPRVQEDWENLSPEARSVIENAPIGIFSLADLYGCHTPGHPDEWMHATFQAAAPNGDGQKMVWRSILRIAFANPGTP